MARGNPRIAFRLPVPLFDDLERLAGELGPHVYARNLLLKHLADESSRAPAGQSDGAPEGPDKDNGESPEAASGGPGPTPGMRLHRRAGIPLAIANRECSEGRVQMHDDGALEWRGTVYR